MSAEGDTGGVGVGTTLVLVSTTKWVFQSPTSSHLPTGPSAPVLRPLNATGSLRTPSGRRCRAFPSWTRCPGPKH